MLRYGKEFLQIYFSYTRVEVGRSLGQLPSKFGEGPQNVKTKGLDSP